jgi:Flp pilus assembly protein TadB
MGVGGVYHLGELQGEEADRDDRGTAARRGGTDGALLRVGHPFVSAVHIVAQRDVRIRWLGNGHDRGRSAYGRDVVGSDESSMAERLDMQDLRFLAVAVTIQQTSGGNLAEILRVWPR